MFQHSRENQFLFDILRLGSNFSTLQDNFPELFAEALYRSPETLALAKSEWTTFANQFYLDAGLQIPEYPQYMEIQVALGDAR